MKKFLLFSLLILIIQEVSSQNDKLLNDESIIFYYNFDSLSNEKLFDISGNKLHGNLYNIKNTKDYGVTGHSFKFDCKDSSRVFIGNDKKLNNNQFTTMAWFKLTSWGDDLTDGREILEKTHAYWLVLKRKYPNQSDETGYVSAGVYDTSNPNDKQGNTHIDAPNDIEFNTWYHVASVYSGNKLTIYVNGKSQGSVNTKPYLYDLDDNLVVGSKQHRDGNFINQFMGNLDEVIMLKRELSITEINDYYESTKNLSFRHNYQKAPNYNITWKNHEITLNAKEFSGQCQAYLYGLDGKRMHRQKITAPLTTFNISAYTTPLILRVINKQQQTIFSAKVL